MTRFLFGVCAVLALLTGWERRQHTTWRDYAKRLEVASQAAGEAQRALRATERKQYEEQAHAVDRNYTEALVDARGAAAAYIAGHRVQPARSCSTPRALGEAGAPGVPAPVPANSDVAVSERDVQACTSAVVYAVQAFGWAQTVGE